MNNQNNQEAIEIIRDIDKAYRTFTKKEIQALEMSIKALSAMDMIKSIINMPHVQEDVIKYQMICEVMKND